MTYSELTRHANAIPLNSLPGIVQIQWIGDWGVICDTDWDMDDAIVVCTSIDFDGGIPIFGLGKTYDANYISDNR